MSSRFTNHDRGCPRMRGRIASSRGFTLIELMIAMLLGLIVIGGVISVFLANQQTYRTSKALGEVQDGSRLAVEMLAHDIRNAQLTGCNNNNRFTNVLKNSPGNGGTTWWANWNNAISGYTTGMTDTAAPTGQVANTDSIQLLGVADTSMSVQTHTPTTLSFTLNGSASDLQGGDVVMVCDPDHATLLKITSYDATSKTIVYDATNNCSTGLGYPGVCVASGNPYTFGPNAQIAKLTAVDWYIGSYTAKDGSTGTSLYRLTVGNNGGTTAQEMVRGVTGLTITYLASGATSFVAPTASTNWAAITAVQVQLTLQSTDNLAGSNAKPLARTINTTVTLRNRVN
ncbi:PilW family protein [Dyella silvae]|uniref:PilW family protein n=1 Tax=Dyella silvae TaxID=2994424 RepID=UPI0022653954|nr:PilW family protein [Dyella silvae]